MAVFTPMPSPKVRTATSVKPGFFSMLRAPNRRSCTNVSTNRLLHASRTLSLTASTPPNCRSACRRASSGASPLPTLSSVWRSRWKRSSASSSRSIRFLRNSAFRARASAVILPPIVSRGLEDPGDRVRQPLPVLGFVGQLPAAGPGQPVELRRAVVVRAAPLRVDPALLLQTVQRRVQRTLVHGQDARRDLLDALRDPPPVHRLE